MKSVMYKNKEGNIDTFSVIAETEKMYRLDTIGWVSRNDPNISEIIVTENKKQILHD